ncbi:MAG: hypothetical protein A3I05_02035 [Deltaproteobacteria bacterium RIFCSPLOWO2_02_FULL_44_10]|nr:MAG: hypothetical protein A3C46_08205 [Deltaproteobacteria bacterium RIFCSPHIGHO2_02_FULL_44_16]OGQ47559.1 MAG: hypothetical protein A3I05_02035 [Deltaproteobacteria bacterium RIFCSPLOWO2_02_FULL_44_10]
MTKLTSRCQLTDFPQDPAFQDLVYLLTLSAELTQLPDEKNRKRAEALFDIAEHRFDDAVIQRALTLIQQGCIQNIKPKNDIPQQSVRQSNLSSQDEVEVKKEEQTTVYESSALDNILWWLAEQDFSFLLPSLFTVQFGPRISSRTTETEQKQSPDIYAGLDLTWHLLEVDALSLGPKLYTGLGQGTASLWEAGAGVAASYTIAKTLTISAHGEFVYVSRTFWDPESQTTMRTGSFLRYGLSAEQKLQDGFSLGGGIYLYHPMDVQYLYRGDGFNLFPYPTSFGNLRAMSITISTSYSL